MENTTPWDVVVVGGSWAGLAAALQLGRARRRVLVIDAGRPRNRFALASHGFPGQDGRSPDAILAIFRAELLTYPTVRIRSGEVVGAGGPEDGEFGVDVAGGPSLRARRIILATGVSDELPAIPGLVERWGRTVAHCPYCHGYEVANLRLGVLATGEPSIHLARLLPDWSDRVTLFTNGTFVPDAGQRAALDARRVQVEGRTVSALEGDAPALEGVALEDGTSVPIDALFVSSRTRLTSSLVMQLGCEVEDGHFGPVVRTGARQETTVPGVFAAGDIARVPHSAILAAADGAMAGKAAHQSLVFDPDETGSGRPGGGVPSAGSGREAGERQRTRSGASR